MKKSKGLILVEIVNTIFMVLLTNSIYWKDFSIKRFWAVIILWVFMLLTPLILNRKNPDIYNILSDNILKFQESVKKNKKAYLLTVFSIIGSFLIPWIFVSFFALINGSSFNVILYSVFVFLLLSIIAIILFLKANNSKPEHLFLALLLIGGTSFIVMSPTQLGIGWDDQIHYEHAESVADLVDGYGLKVDEQITGNFTNAIGVYGRMIGYSEAERLQYDKEYNDCYRNNKFGVQNRSYGVWSIAYVPYAVGAIIGRGLSLPFTWTFSLSKIVNLIFYGLIIYCGAKKLKTGKIAALTVGLIPTAVFMASSFSYDPWVIAWTLYGYCYFLSFLQDHTKKMSRLDAIKIVGAFVIGCMPKAVYFVMMFPLLFLPARCFETKKEHYQYLGLVVIGALLLVSTFILPLLFNGASDATDTRGGSEVNATEQLKFILSEPFAYAKILFKFLISYLDISNAGEYVMNFAYLQDHYFTGIGLIAVFSTILLDKDGKHYKTWPVIISTLAGCILTIVLVATALYISFTPVRGNTVNGCQFRYILPVLFPTAYIITPEAVTNHLNQKWFCVIQFSFLTLLFIFNTSLLMYGLY